MGSNKNLFRRGGPKPEKKKKKKTHFFLQFCHCRPILGITSLTGSLHDIPKCFFLGGGGGGSKIARFVNLGKKKKKCNFLGRHIHTDRDGHGDSMTESA